MNEAPTPPLPRPLASIIAIGALAIVTPHAVAQQRTPFELGWDSGTPTSIAGELRVRYVDDFANGRSELVHVVVDSRTGKEFRLRFERGVPPGLRSGLRITARGRAVNSEIYLAASDASGVTVPSGSSMTAAPMAPVTGDQKTLVVVADFIDRPVNPSVFGGDCSIAAIGDRVFSDPLGYSVDRMYREASNGKLSFSGRVVGPYLINAATTDACDLNAWSQAADAQVAASGVDLAAYPRKVYVMPDVNCGAAGIGELGVTPSRAWVFACDRHRVYAHELGHNLGLHHASTSTDEYGDDSDVMGIPSRLKPFNAPHKRQMGWVQGAQIVTVTRDGSYDLAPLALDASTATAPQVLQINVPGTADSYYVSYRSGTSGFEANVGIVYQDRISVHRWAGGSNMTTLLASLGDGERFVDPSNGFAVTPITHNQVTATAQIRMGADCGRVTPSVSLAPADQSGPAGSAVDYDVAIANNDAPGCGPSSFALSAAVSSNWAGALSAPALSVAPGAVGSARLTVTSPSAAVPGAYAVGIDITDPAAAAHAASAGGTYTVPSGDTAAPSVPAGLAARLKAGTINLSWSPAADNVRVAGYQVWRNGTVMATTATLSLTDSSATAGTYTYWVVAFDAAGNQSAASNAVSVQLSGARKRK